MGDAYFSSEFLFKYTVAATKIAPMCRQFYCFEKCIEILKTIRIVGVTTFILVNRYVSLLTLTNRMKILQKMTIP